MFFFLNLKHCISFAKHQNKSATGIHTLPILNPPPSSLPTPSLWVVPVHQPQASSIMHRTWTGNSFHTWYYTCFNAILPIRKYGFKSEVNTWRKRENILIWLVTGGPAHMLPFKNKTKHTYSWTNAHIQDILYNK